mmetsp:Transcript_14205/g.61857  ORF Transcript_14205/g.61857 Transcript_14205/m.61857 type:complete len:209 (-) Transcript_14205:3328-3954(-)
MRRRARGPVHRGIARRRDRRRFARHLREVQDDVRSHRGAEGGGGAGEPARRGDGARPAGAARQRRHARPLRLPRRRRHRRRHSWRRHTAGDESVRAADDDGGVERDAARRRVARVRGRGPTADDASARGDDARGSVRRVRAGAGADSIARRRHRARAGFFRRRRRRRRGRGRVRRGDLVPAAGARSGTGQTERREAVVRGLRRQRRVL